MIYGLNQIKKSYKCNGEKNIYIHIIVNSKRLIRYLN